jgi:hypothetical protein
MEATERAAQIWSVLAWAATSRQVLTYRILGKLIGVPARGLGHLLEPVQSYCLRHGLPPLTILVVSEDTGLPSSGFTAAEDIPRNQLTVFAYDWLDHGAPSPEDLAEAVSKLPSRSERTAETIDTVRSLGDRARDVTSRARALTIEQYWPAIERAWSEKIGPAALSTVRDDEKVAGIARALYPVLPMPVRLLVGESDFVNFCITNKAKLLALAKDAAATTQQSTGDTGAS